ncbi:MAG: hypothetical protein QMD08_07015, partial [Actinomycetota bacterium]|nr:hypothetical protein [Actinomycetota bacterium]
LYCTTIGQTSTRCIGITFLFGFNIIEVFRRILIHQEVFNQSRVYSTWVVRNLYDFFAFLGVPICFLLARKLIWQFKKVKEDGIKQLDVMFFASALTLVILDVLGVTRGEVARMWMFLVPLAVLVGVSELKDLDILKGKVLFSRSFSIVLLLFLQFAQVVTYKAFINLH